MAALQWGRRRTAVSAPPLALTSPTRPTATGVLITRVLEVDGRPLIRPSGPASPAVIAGCTTRLEVAQSWVHSSSRSLAGAVPARAGRGMSHRGRSRRPRRPLPGSCGPVSVAALPMARRPAPPSRLLLRQSTANSALLQPAHGGAEHVLVLQHIRNVLQQRGKYYPDVRSQLQTLLVSQSM